MDARILFNHNDGFFMRRSLHCRSDGNTASRHLVGIQRVPWPVVVIVVVTVAPHEPDQQADNRDHCCCYTSPDTKNIPKDLTNNALIAAGRRSRNNVTRRRRNVAIDNIICCVVGNLRIVRHIIGDDVADTGIIHGVIDALVVVKHVFDQRVICHVFDRCLVNLTTNVSEFLP